MSSEEDTYNVIFQALRHPVRRSILRRLDAQPMTFTGLLNELRIDNGLLNYHLNNLNELITKGPDEKYRLSEFGAATLSLTRRVEEPVKHGDGAINILGWKTPVSLVLVIVVVLLFSTNVYLAYSINNLSHDKTNAQGWTLLQARGNIGESINILNAALDEGRLELGALNVLQSDMVQASRYLRIASILDEKHQEQWNTLGQASDNLAQASRQIMIKMASSSDTETEISFGQELYLEKISGDLERMGKVFPEELVLGSSPRIVYDEEQMTDAFMAAMEFDGSLNGLYEAFNIGRSFSIAFGEDYFWVEDDA